jgi:hypothetical protein
VRIGKLTIRNHRVAIIDVDDIRFRLLGLITVFKIDGIVGWNAIRNLDLQVDYPHRTMTLRESEQRDWGERNFYDLGQPTLALTDEQGTRMNFFLDTGANMTSLLPGILPKLPAQKLASRTTYIGAAGGFERFNAKVVPRLTLCLCGHALDFRNLSTSPEMKNSFVTLDGTLGNDLLRRGTLRLDSRNGYCDLNPQPMETTERQTR